MSPELSHRVTRPFSDAKLAGEEDLLMKLLPIIAALLALSAAPAFAATVQVQIDDVPYTGPSNPKGIKLVVGQPFGIDIAIKGGKAVNPLWLKHDANVEMNGAANNPTTTSEDFSFFMVPLHPGPLVFPAIDIPMVKGPVLHIDPIRLLISAK